MTFEIIRDIFGWCALINIGFLIWWGIAIVFMHDFVYRMHSRWFKMPVEDFDRIHYVGLAFYNLVPYLAMRIVG